MLFLSIAIFFAALGVLHAKVAQESYIFPLPVTNQSVSNITTKVGSRPLDTVYITSPNSTTYEWWYFDAVASDLSASIVLQPVVQGGFFGLVLDFSFANGTGAQFTLPSDKGYFSTTGDGSNMNTSNEEWSYTSSPDLFRVVFDLNIPSVGVNGTVKFQSVAPPHVACSDIHYGASLDFYWNLFWVNLIPDALTSVNLIVNGTVFKFEGIGYHDKNWATYPFMADINQWYWGHGRTDEYSVVWFYRINKSGGVNTSAYISKDGKIIYTGCGDRVSVRTITDRGIVYPVPYAYNGTIVGVEMSIDAGKIGKFAFTAISKYDILHGDTYDRWIGNYTGGLVGHKYSTGVGLWEMMGPFPTPM